MKDVTLFYTWGIDWIVKSGHSIYQGGVRSEYEFAIWGPMSWRAS